MLRYELLRKSLLIKRFKKVGMNAKIQPYITVTYANNVILGCNVKIQSESYIMAGAATNETIEICDNVSLGKGITIVTRCYDLQKHQLDLLRKLPPRTGNVLIKEGAFIGCGAIILPGVTIGERAMIPPYSIVFKDVADHTVWTENNAAIFL